MNAAPGSTSGMYSTFDKADETAAESDGCYIPASSVTMDD